MATAGKRRERGEGAIYQDQRSKRWCCALDLGVVDGKRKRKIVSAATKKEVVEKLKTLQAEQQHGGVITTKSDSLSIFLEKWLSEKVALNTKPRTVESYRAMIRLHIVPGLGKTKLEALTPQHVDSLLTRKRAEGLSARTVQYLRGILRAALNTAIKWGLVSKNVAALADAPTGEKYEPHPLTPDQAQAFLQAAEGDRCAALYRLALSVGLRQGELLGLRWADIDLDAGSLRVEQTVQVVAGRLVFGTPKTKTSKRTLPLTPALIATLRLHHARQLAERLKAGGRWKDHDLVFCTTIGTPQSPRNVVRDFKALLANAGLPGVIRFHDLRHSCASYLAAHGVAPKVAMELLGHASIVTTMNIYTHAFTADKVAAGVALDAMFTGGKRAG